MLDDQPVFIAQQFVNRSSRLGADIDAFPAKVPITQRRVHKERARSQRAKEFRKIERDGLQLPAVVAHAWHVANLAPTAAEEPVALGSIIIIRIRIKPAAAGQHGDARVEHRRINRVVSAKRMADRAKATGGIHVRHCLQQIQRARVIVNGLHGAAHVTELAEVRPVIGQVRVRRRDGHIATLRQFRRISPSFAPTQAHHHLVPHTIVCRMQTKHRRCLPLFQDRLGNAKICRRP